MQTVPTVENMLVIGMILYFTILAIVIKVLIQRDKKIELEKYRIDMEFGSDIRVEKQLDEIINSVFDEYRLYNLEFRDDAYIKEADETKIVLDICDLVVQRISPVFITQLSTYFNTDSIGEVIASKISAKVMEYRITRNIQGQQINKK